VPILAELAGDEDFWAAMATADPTAALTGSADMFDERAMSRGQLMAASQAFSQIIDFRSRFTATHTRGVAETAVCLAEKAGFDAPGLDQMRLAGNLHDLGKLAVPAEILEKPGALNQPEAEIMRRHAEIGARVLSSVPGLEDVAEYGGRHHERPNGRGYPQGLTRSELRRPSLLLSVADVFTALLEDRPYRPGMTPAQTRGLLTSLAEAGDLDRDAVRLLLSRQNIVAEIRRLAQLEAQEQFDAFAAA
jgi:HD-GYP domain-containing protein (c-di-GMP phosphodiesterase class II)